MDAVRGDVHQAHEVRRLAGRRPVGRQLVHVDIHDPHHVARVAKAESDIPLETIPITAECPSRGIYQVGYLRGDMRQPLLCPLWIDAEGGQVAPDDQPDGRQVVPCPPRIDDLVLHGASQQGKSRGEPCDRLRLDLPVPVPQCRLELLHHGLHEGHRLGKPELPWVVRQLNQLLVNFRNGLQHSAGLRHLRDGALRGRDALIDAPPVNAGQPHPHREHMPCRQVPLLPGHILEERAHLRQDLHDGQDLVVPPHMTRGQVGQRHDIPKFVRHQLLPPFFMSG